MPHTVNFPLTNTCFTHHLVVMAPKSKRGTKRVDTIPCPRSVKVGEVILTTTTSTWVNDTMFPYKGLAANVFLRTLSTDDSPAMIQWLEKPPKTVPTPKGAFGGICSDAALILAEKWEAAATPVINHVAFSPAPVEPTTDVHPLSATTLCTTVAGIPYVLDEDEGNCVTFGLIKDGDTPTVHIFVLATKLISAGTPLLRLPYTTRCSIAFANASAVANHFVALAADEFPPFRGAPFPFTNSRRVGDPSTLCQDMEHFVRAIRLCVDDSVLSPEAHAAGWSEVRAAIPLAQTLTTTPAGECIDWTTFPKDTYSTMHGSKVMTIERAMRRINAKNQTAEETLEAIATRPPESKSAELEAVEAIEEGKEDDTDTKRANLTLVADRIVADIVDAYARAIGVLAVSHLDIDRARRAEILPPSPEMDTEDTMSDTDIIKVLFSAVAPSAALPEHGFASRNDMIALALDPSSSWVTVPV
jgi:hypothetical protein